MKKKPQGEAIPSYETRIDSGTFILRCKEGSFTDSDGFGEWATEDRCFPELPDVHPSDVRKEGFTPPYPFVVWYSA